MPDRVGLGKPPQRIEWFENYTAYKENQPYIVDLVTLQSLGFQSIPNELSFEGESSFAAIEAPGRNNPLYHYTGSEDILKFTLSWFADHESREDVISKCLWLRGLTKNDGYDNKPHHVKLVFGELFKQSKWIVAEAPFKIGLFNRKVGMFPQLATQDLVLKRVSELNISNRDFINPRY